MRSAAAERVNAQAPELDKPAYGSPCNNCGFCCRAELCPLGAIVFGTWSGPCPALEPHGAGFGCGLVANPQTYRPTRTKLRGRAAMSQAAIRLIGSGLGCDALREGEADDPAFRERMKSFYAAERREVRRAKIVWGVGER